MVDEWKWRVGVGCGTGGGHLIVSVTVGIFFFHNYGCNFPSACESPTHSGGPGLRCLSLEKRLSLSPGLGNSPMFFVTKYTIGCRSHATSDVRFKCCTAQILLFFFLSPLLQKTNGGHYLQTRESERERETLLLYPKAIAVVRGKIGGSGMGGGGKGGGLG
ncbi:unnamed protein product [Arctogadus glacialis]